MADTNYCFPILQPRTMTLMEERDVSEKGYWAVIKHTGQVKPGLELGEVGAFYDHEMDRLLDALERLKKLESVLLALKLSPTQIETLPQTIARMEEELKFKNQKIELVEDQLARKTGGIRKDEGSEQRLSEAIVRMEDEIRGKTRLAEECRQELERKNEELHAKDEDFERRLADELFATDKAHKLEAQRRDQEMEDITRKCDQSIWILSQRCAQLQEGYEQLQEGYEQLQQECQHLSKRVAKNFSIGGQTQVNTLSRTQGTDSQIHRPLPDAQVQFNINHQHFRDQLAIKHQQQRWELENRLSGMEHNLDLPNVELATADPLGYDQSRASVSTATGGREDNSVYQSSNRGASRSVPGHFNSFVAFQDFQPPAKDYQTTGTTGWQDDKDQLSTASSSRLFTSGRVSTLVNSQSTTEEKAAKRTSGRQDGGARSLSSSSRPSAYGRFTSLFKLNNRSTGPAAASSRSRPGTLFENTDDSTLTLRRSGIGTDYGNAIPASSSRSSQILSTCVRCTTSAVDVRFLPCRHELLCASCFHQLSLQVQEGDNAGSSPATRCLMCSVPIHHIEELIPVEPRRSQLLSSESVIVGRRATAASPLSGRERDPSSRQLLAPPRSTPSTKSGSAVNKVNSSRQSNDSDSTTAAGTEHSANSNVASPRSADSAEGGEGGPHTSPHTRLHSSFGALEEAAASISDNSNSATGPRTFPSNSVSEDQVQESTK